MLKYLKLLLRLWKLLKEFHTHFYVQLFSTLVQQGINIATVFFTAKILDAIIKHSAGLAFIYLGAYFIAKLIRNRIGFYTEIHSLKKIDNAIQQFLEQYSFTKIFSLNISQYAEGHSSIKYQVINRGESAVESIVSNTVLSIFPAITQIVFSLIAISIYSVTISIWCGVSIAILIYWGNRFTTKQRPNVKKNIDNFDNQKKVRTEAFQHLSLIKFLAAEEYFLKKYLSHKESVLAFGTKTATTSFIHSYRRDLFIQTSRVVSTLILVLFALKNTITIGAIYAVWSWLYEAYGTIGTLMQNMRQFPLRFAELEKYLEIIDAQAHFSEQGKALTSSLVGDITFSSVDFKYPQSVNALFEKLTFTIPSKKVTAFVGESGSGKSTITKLLMRSYDYAGGSITFGDTELRSSDAKFLRKNIGYVEQHVDLFDDTIRENILLGVEEKHQKVAGSKLDDVARHARIDQFFHRLGEKKFDTVIGERGIKLSGGERQRIGIARAIIKDPEILIFDEATSSLDAENESKVMEAINDVSRDKTTIIIAHRLSTVRNADKIIVMDKGRVAGEGTHDELLATNAIYQNLVAHQMSGSDK